MIFKVADLIDVFTTFNTSLNHAICKITKNSLSYQNMLYAKNKNFNIY